MNMPAHNGGDAIRQHVGPQLVAIAVACIAVCLTFLASFTVFHTLTELSYVTIVCSVFAVAWTLRAFSDDDFAVYLGMALMASGVLHLVHLVDYPSLGVLSGSFDPPTQLWVAASFVEGVSFLIAPFVLGHRINMGLVLLAYGLVVGLILASVYWWHIFPSALVEGEGLTTFKRVAEYVICALFLAGIAVLWRRRRWLVRGAFVLLAAALMARVIAEIWFAVYTGPLTWPVFVGHVFLLVSAVLIYQAVVQETLTRPHALAVSNLQLREEAARALQQQEESLRRTLDQLLRLTPSFHVESDYAAIAKTACEGARELFGCHVATLFEAHGDLLRLVAADPPKPRMHTLSMGMDDDAYLARQLETHVPVFMGGLHGQKIGPRLAQIRSMFGIRSVLRVPIGLDERAQRMLALCWTDDVESPDARVRALVQRYGDQVDVGLTQARRREAQEETERLHRRFERSLLPKLPISHPQVDMRLHYRPRESRLELGGDFIDIVDCGESGLAVIVGDVSGHGPDAAALGATLRSGWEALVMADEDPVAVGTALREVAERERATLETFATAFLTWINAKKNQISVLNLGHPPPLLCSNGAVSPLTAPPQPPIGGFMGNLEPPLRLTLPPDWSLLFYTDGLIEGRISPNDSERYGSERLVEAVAALPRPIDSAGLGRLVADVRAAGCEPFKDDVTVVLIAKTE